MKARVLIFAVPILVSAAGAAAVVFGGSTPEITTVKEQSIVPPEFFDGKRVLVYAIGSCSSCKTETGPKEKPAPVRWKLPKADVDAYLAFGPYREPDIARVRLTADKRFTLVADPYEELAYAFGLRVGEFAVIEDGKVTKVRA